VLKKLWGSEWLRGTRDPLRTTLGRLELAVMEVVWRGGEGCVRDVQAALARPAAYTTIMTTLDRLYKKGFVTRRRDGRAFVYSAATMTAGLLKGLLADDASAARPCLSNLVDAMGERDNQLLDELEQLVRDKRERMKKKDAL
jgi:predicted transcriptional regulator